jgi:hypothetical protein
MGNTLPLIPYYDRSKEGMFMRDKSSKVGSEDSGRGSSCSRRTLQSYNNKEKDVEMFGFSIPCLHF